jgi:hypothetical protein
VIAGVPALGDPIVADGYTLHFNVDSQFGAFEVSGVGALRKLVRELQAIAELRTIKGTEAGAQPGRPGWTVRLRVPLLFPR